MYPENNENTKRKVIASFVVVCAVVVISIVITGLAHDKDFVEASSATSTSAPAATSATTTSTTTTPSSSSMGSGSNMMSSGYKDGSYSATDNYGTPGGTETITVSVTLKGGTVTGTSIGQQANNRDSADYQSAFKQSYSSSVVGKLISNISLSHVSGSSLTSRGFNAALEQIKTQAQS